MKKLKTGKSWSYFLLAASMAFVADSLAQRPDGEGVGPGLAESQHRRGRHGMGGWDDAHAQDMELFHYLLDHGNVIDRRVEERDDGVETWTESDDPEVAEKIREHVLAMVARVVESRPIHRRDPLFAELFDHAEDIEIVHDMTDKGIHVIERSDDPYVAQLIQAHAEVVSRFVERGRREMRKNHAMPKKRP